MEVQVEIGIPVLNTHSISHTDTERKSSHKLRDEVTENNDRPNYLFVNALCTEGSQRVNEMWRGGWDSNPRDLSVTDLAGLRPTRLGDPRTRRPFISL